jgi:hypothetical protein
VSDGSGGTSSPAGPIGTVETQLDAAAAERDTGAVTIEATSTPIEAAPEPGTACTPDGQGCAFGTNCCSRLCVTGVCKPGGLCRPIGRPCISNGECCSDLCGACGVCEGAGAYCIQVGDVCARSLDCCTGACRWAPDASIGTCVAGGSVASRPGCPTCAADDAVCSDGASCCSGWCTAGVCRPLPISCRTAGNQCESDDACCSRLCVSGTCSRVSPDGGSSEASTGTSGGATDGGVSTCALYGQMCATTDECCNGDLGVACLLFNGTRWCVLQGLP